VKRFVIPIVISLSLSVSATPIASASVTPGTKCLKVGAKQTFKGKIYTCVKLGKSQVWNKGATPIQAVPSPKPITSPTQTVQDDFVATSRFLYSGDPKPNDGDRWFESIIDCKVKSPGEYQVQDSFISIFDPSGNLLVRKSLTGIYRDYVSGESASYWVYSKEMIKNSGKTYSCLFDVVRLDGSQVTKEFPVKVASIVKFPLPKPQTVIYPMSGIDTGLEVACLLTNWRDYSLDKSKVTLFRDDGSILTSSGFTYPHPWSYFKPLNPNKYYLGIYLWRLESSGEIDRGAGKRYMCKYELVGFTGEKLVHTEIVQMPVPPTPTPTPTPLPLITPGALCAPAGATGKWGNGTIYTCKTSPLDTTTRWRL
jgi:hypothetical protein